LGYLTFKIGKSVFDLFRRYVFERILFDDFSFRIRGIGYRSQDQCRPVSFIETDKTIEKFGGLAKQNYQYPGSHRIERSGVADPFHPEFFSYICDNIMRGHSSRLIYDDYPFH
jgi:hypothetical protein